MSTILTLDLSKSSTGFMAMGYRGVGPVSGTWLLGSSMTTTGQACINLHQRLNDLYSVSPFDTVIYESPLQPRQQQAGDERGYDVPADWACRSPVDSFCEAKRVRKYRCVNQTTWRRHFIGSMKRGTKTVQWKAYAMERCIQLGFRPQHGRSRSTRRIGLYVRDGGHRATLAPR